MSKQYLSFALVVVMGMTAIGCTEWFCDPVAEPPRPHWVGVGMCGYIYQRIDSIIPSFEGELVFHIEEMGFTDDEPPKQKICVVTNSVMDYSCANFMIGERIRVEPGVMKIQIMSLLVPEDCETPPGPASDSQGFVLQNGKYILRFSNADSVDDYQLVADGETITINQPHSGSFTTYAPPDCFGGMDTLTFDNNVSDLI